MAEKQKYHIEYLVKASLEMLYQYISTASGLAEWFCDAANSKGNQFTFIWAGSEEQATLIARREDSLVRFRWLPTKAKSITSRSVSNRMNSPAMSP